jgi:hypothetical protein
MQARKIVLAGILHWNLRRLRPMRSSTDFMCAKAEESKAQRLLGLANQPSSETLFSHGVTVKTVRK